MTQQYLAGELSLLLAQLRCVAPSQASADAVALLRQETETRPIAALSTLAARALDLSDAMCWDSVGRGDAATFARQAAVSAELYEFGICAGLLKEA